MDSQRVSKFVNELEDKYPVNEWQINGVHVWPMIKVKIFFASNRGSQMMQIKQHTKINFLKPISGIWKLMRFFLSKSYKVVDLYSNAPHFRYKHSKTYTNRYFNGLLNKHLPNNTFIFLEYGNVTSEYRRNVDYPAQTFFLEDFKYTLLVIRNLRYYVNNIDTSQWKEFNAFCIEVQEKLGNSKINHKEIIRQYLYVDTLRWFYRRLLLKYSVEKVYTLCYYVSENYALNLASADLNILSCDIQHGGQGKLHVAYSSYNKVPLNGYKFLPKKFWCWDQASADVIKQWVRKQKYHSVEVDGNPWIDYCQNAFEYNIKTGKKIILYTMQPIGDHLLDPFIIETIAKTPEDFVWWLRLHPRQVELKGKLKDLLKNHHLFNWEIDLATEMPLPAILKNVHVHISKSSGSILEAYMLNKFSVIIRDTGVKMYPEVVNSNLSSVVLTEKSDDLIKAILDFKY